MLVRVYQRRGRHLSCDFRSIRMMLVLAADYPPADYSCDFRSIRMMLVHMRELGKRLPSCDFRSIRMMLVLRVRVAAPASGCDFRSIRMMLVPTSPTPPLLLSCDFRSIRMMLVHFRFMYLILLYKIRKIFRKILTEPEQREDRSEIFLGISAFSRTVCL